VWEQLTRDEDATFPELAELFRGTEVVEKPEGTIARKIADERPGELRHVDIRALHADNLSIKERDEAMARRIMEILEDAESVVVIVGESHREGIAERLRGEGLTVVTFCFQHNERNLRSP
jgi:hypothetical protein